MTKDEIKCECCLKNDVCGKKEKIKDDLEKLKLSAEFQKLENSGIEIKMSCTNYFAKSPKIL